MSINIGKLKRRFSYEKGGIKIKMTVTKKPHTRFLCKTLFDKVVREVKKKNKNQKLVKCIIPKQICIGYWRKEKDGVKDGPKVFVKNTLGKLEITECIKNVLLLNNQSDYDGFSQFYDLMLERDQKNRVSLNDDVLSVVRGFLTPENPLSTKQLYSGKKFGETHSIKVKYCENTDSYHLY